MHTFKTALVLLTFVAASAFPSPGQSSDTKDSKIQDLQKQIDLLRGQVAELREQLKNTKSSTDQTSGTNTAQAPAPEPSAELKGAQGAQVGKAVSEYQTFSQDQQAAARPDNAPLDPKYPGFFRLPGTNTFLKIGGYFKTDFIYDLKPAGDPERFIPSSIPVPTPAGVNNTTVSIRPTRLNLDFRAPTEKFGDIRVYIEGDLFGSNSTTPRLRHAYTQVRNLLIGQTFTGFQDPDAGPDQLDFQGPNAQVSLRNPQLRYTFKLHKKTDLSFSVEKASSDIAFKTPNFSSQPNSPGPDGAVKFRHGMERGHVQIAGMFRGIGAFLPNGVSDSVVGWGISGSGSLRTFGKDTFVYQVAYGRGVERYVNDTSGLGIDAAVISNAQPRLRALPVVAPYGAYQHWWTSHVRSSVIYGFVQVDNTAFQPGTTFHKSNYAAGNLIWNPFGSLNIGAEYLYGWTRRKDGTGANTPRFMFSAKYNFDFVKKPAI